MCVRAYVRKQATCCALTVLPYSVALVVPCHARTACHHYYYFILLPCYTLSTSTQFICRLLVFCSLPFPFLSLSPTRALNITCCLFLDELHLFSESSLTLEVGKAKCRVQCGELSNRAPIRCWHERYCCYCAWSGDWNVLLTIKSALFW